MARTDAQLSDAEVLQVQQLGDLPDSEANQAIAKENGVLVNKDLPSWGSANWWDIGWTLSDQTDLQTALDWKANNSEVIKSIAWTPTWADRITNAVSLTQAEFDASTPDSATLYFITDA